MSFLLVAALGLLGLFLYHFGRWFFKPLILSMKHAQRESDVSVIPATDKQEPCLNDPASKTITIVVPAYNEEERLPKMLDEALEFMEAWKARKAGLTYEILLSNDGSRDRTVEVVKQYMSKFPGDVIRCVSRVKNRGKGAAVRTGMQFARGQYILFADADGATRISDLERLLSELQGVERDGLGVGVGSRHHYAKDIVRERKWYRNLLMHGLHFLVTVVGGVRINDTQCGFKLFSRRAAQAIFPSQHMEHWSFDVELLFLARSLGIPMVEVPVNWQEIPGSKVDVVEASLSMSRDLVLIRLLYLLRVWRPLYTDVSQLPAAAKKIN